MTNGQIAAAGVVYCAAAITLVVSQYHAPKKYRPLTIWKHCWEALKAFAAASYRQHRKNAAERAARRGERQQGVVAWHNRPCHACGYTGHFHSKNERRLVSQKSSGGIIVQIAVIVFILAPLTCGLGLLCLFFIGSGKKYAVEHLQVCPNCGTTRPR